MSAIPVSAIPMSAIPMSAMPMSAISAVIEPRAERSGARLARCSRGAGRGQSLSALRASDLRDRFYSWRGASGRNYVCSVFRLSDEALLTDFAHSLFIGVAREGAGRRPLCALASRDFGDAAGAILRAEAMAQGLSEWHVHFCADEAEVEDLVAGLAG